MGAGRCVVGVILVTVLAWGCATSGNPRPEPFPRTTGRSGVPSVEPGAVPTGQEIARAAQALVGRPYAAGGAGPDRFDCSGLVQYVYARAGVALPRTVTEQMRVGQPISLDQIAPGDLLFFRIDASKPSHVGIAIGNGAFVHAPNARGEVRVERVSAGYWVRRFELAKRVLADR
jgi:cell wall-associated NlpC family hydrolase